MERYEFGKLLHEHGITLHGQYCDFWDTLSFHHDGNSFQLTHHWTAAEKGYLPKYDKDSLDDIVAWKESIIRKESE